MSSDHVEPDATSAWDSLWGCPSVTRCISTCVEYLKGHQDTPPSECCLNMRFLVSVGVRVGFHTICDCTKDDLRRSFDQRRAQEEIYTLCHNYELDYQIPLPIAEGQFSSVGKALLSYHIPYVEPDDYYNQSTPVWDDDPTPTQVWDDDPTWGCPVVTREISTCLEYLKGHQDTPSPACCKSVRYLVALSIAVGSQEGICYCTKDDLRRSFNQRRAQEEIYKLCNFSNDARRISIAPGQCPNVGKALSPDHIPYVEPDDYYNQPPPVWDDDPTPAQAPVWDDDPTSVQVWDDDPTPAQVWDDDPTWGCPAVTREISTCLEYLKGHQDTPSSACCKSVRYLIALSITVGSQEGICYCTKDDLRRSFDQRRAQEEIYKLCNFSNDVRRISIAPGQCPRYLLSPAYCPDVIRLISTCQEYLNGHQDSPSQTCCDNLDDLDYITVEVGDDIVCHCMEDLQPSFHQDRAEEIFQKCGFDYSFLRITKQQCFPWYY
nr:non-specific lipid-transfer protein A [Ipomoea batatas]